MFIGNLCHQTLHIQMPLFSYVLGVQMPKQDSINGVCALTNSVDQQLDAKE